MVRATWAIDQEHLLHGAEPEGNKIWTAQVSDEDAAESNSFCLLGLPQSSYEW